MYITLSLKKARRESIEIEHFVTVTIISGTSDSLTFAPRPSESRWTVAEEFKIHGGNSYVMCVMLFASFLCVEVSVHACSAIQARLVDTWVGY